MVVPAVSVIVLGRRLAAMTVGGLHAIIVVMVVLIDSYGIADVADLVRVPSGRGSRHAKRHRGDSERVAEKTKSGRHGRRS